MAPQNHPFEEVLPTYWRVQLPFLSASYSPTSLRNIRIVGQPHGLIYKFRVIYNAQGFRNPG